MEDVLLKTRIKAFWHELFALLGGEFLMFLGSDGFRTLIENHWGGTLAGTFIVLAISALSKNRANKKALGRLRGDGDTAILI